jgi:hypothetical protein
MVTEARPGFFDWCFQKKYDPAMHCESSLPEATAAQIASRICRLGTGSLRKACLA